MKLAQLRGEWQEEGATLSVYAKNLFIPTDIEADGEAVVISADAIEDNDSDGDGDGEYDDGEYDGGAVEDELLLAAKLDTKTGRAKATKFFRKWLGDPELEMVTAGPCASETWAKGQPRMHVANQESARLIEVDAAARHQFSNTKQVEGNQMIHIVNMNTVAAISKAFGGDDIGWQRFRPNVLITDCPAWSEFEWVGKTIHLGTATVKVTKRTVRCDATKVNPKTAVADLDVPALLSKHFPQHGPYVGVYAIVVTAGNVTAGDVVGF